MVPGDGDTAAGAVGVVDAIWHADSGRACRGEGACWAFIAEKLRFILFGRFP